MYFRIVLENEFQIYTNHTTYYDRVNFKVIASLKINIFSFTVSCDYNSL